MKVTSFFKLLNRKINKYDKAISNPFETPPLPIVIVWVEESENKIYERQLSMDTKKIIKKINENKSNQVDKYVEYIKEIVKKYPEYYKNKDYAKKFNNK